MSERDQEEARERARRKGRETREGPQRVERRARPARHPLTPRELAGEDLPDMPSQAEGERETVEEDLRIQEEKEKRGR